MNLLRLFSRRITVVRLVFFVSVSILALESFNPIFKANGLSINTVVNKAASRIPEAWKNDVYGQPRSCKVIKQTLRIATKVVLLGGGSPSSPSEIVVEADSNRAAIQGNLRKLSIGVKDSRSPMGLLEIERINVEGLNLKLGWAPLITTAGVPILLFVPPIRQTVWTLSFYYYLWTVVRKLAKRSATSTSEETTTTVVARNIDQKMGATQDYIGKWRKRFLRGSPSQLRFEVVLSNENLANSFLLKQSSKSLLAFLMKNSVLQTAAIVGDAVSDTPIPEQPRQNQFLGASAGNLAKFDPQQKSFSSGPKNNFKRLLSATAFELREAPTFRPEDGTNLLQFESVAILPDDKARLEFVLRTTLEAGRGGQSSSLRFVKPECRFDVTEATSSFPLPKVVSNLFPDVLWLPIGSGVSIGGGNDTTASGGLSIRDIKVLPGGKCRIDGNLSLLQPPGNGGLVRLK